jgi:purine-binding chemotaxis protein CheW
MTVRERNRAERNRAERDAADKDAAEKELEQLLTFEQRGDEYALPLLRVREIVEYRSVTGLPATPPYVLGVIDLRGMVVPVIDMAAKLGLGPSPISSRSCIVLVETELGPSGALVGVLVDAVRGVIELSAEEIEGIAAESETETKKSWNEIERASGPIWLLDIDVALSEEDVPVSAKKLAAASAEDAESSGSSGDDAGVGER